MSSFFFFSFQSLLYHCALYCHRALPSRMPDSATYANTQQSGLRLRTHLLRPMGQEVSQVNQGERLQHFGFHSFGPEGGQFVCSFNWWKA